MLLPPGGQEKEQVAGAEEPAKVLGTLLDEPEQHSTREVYCDQEASQISKHGDTTTLQVFAYQQNCPAEPLAPRVCGEVMTAQADVLVVSFQDLKENLFDALPVQHEGLVGYSRAIFETLQPFQYKPTQNGVVGVAVYTSNRLHVLGEAAVDKLPENSSGNSNVKGSVIVSLRIRKDEAPPVCLIAASTHGADGVDIFSMQDRAMSMRCGVEKLSMRLASACEAGNLPLVVYGGDFNSRFARQGVPLGLHTLPILDIETVTGCAGPVPSKDWDKKAFCSGSLCEAISFEKFPVANGAGFTGFFLDNRRTADFEAQDLSEEVDFIGILGNELVTHRHVMQPLVDCMQLQQLSTYLGHVRSAAPSFKLDEKGVSVGALGGDRKYQVGVARPYSWPDRIFYLGGRVPLTKLEFPEDTFGSDHLGLRCMIAVPLTR